MQLSCAEELQGYAVNLLARPSLLKKYNKQYVVCIA